MTSKVRQFILLSLLATEGQPLGESLIKDAVRRAFPAVAFTDADLSGHIRWCESQGLIIGTADELTGTIWGLTDKGRIRAVELRR